MTYKDTRILNLNEINNNKGSCIVYIVSRDQRINDNHPLLYAYKESIKLNVPLIVAFNLTEIRIRNVFQYKFMINGLKEMQRKLNQLNINFVVTQSKALTSYILIEKHLNPISIYFDFSPLRGVRKSKIEFSKQARSNCYLVDTHNIIPVWVTSEKEEFAAYTIRPKITRLLDQYLIEPEKINKIDSVDKEFIVRLNNFNNFNIYLNPDNHKWDDLTTNVTKQKEEHINYSPNFIAGEDEALKKLHEFIKSKLIYYLDKRNIPGEDYQSNLSPYLHFGNISSLRVVLEINKYLANNINDINYSRLKQSATSLIEEMVVRKELSDNFCYYNNNYDSFEGVKEWAKKTLNKHKDDKREKIYSLEELEYSKTSDIAWNASQTELTTKGKIHGYMRMYWAKKILEWTTDPSTAIKYCIYLNDKYSLDGYDPNGYVGILWSIGGIHDRAWFERPVFGQIRYMNYNGLKRKFNIQKYIDQVNNLSLSF